MRSLDVQLWKVKFRCDTFFSVPIFADLCRSLAFHAWFRRGLDSCAAETLALRASLCPRVLIFSSLPIFAELCRSLPNFAHLCRTLPYSAELCKSLPNFANLRSVPPPGSAAWSSRPGCLGRLLGALPGSLPLCLAVWVVCLVFSARPPGLCLATRV